LESALSAKNFSEKKKARITRRDAKYRAWIAEFEAMSPAEKEAKIAPLKAKLDKLQAKFDRKSPSQAARSRRPFVVCGNAGAAWLVNLDTFLCVDARGGVYGLGTIGVGYSFNFHAAFLVGFGSPADGYYWGASAGLWVGAGGSAHWMTHGDENPFDFIVGGPGVGLGVLAGATLTSVNRLRH
jgi:uncharacterized small protein (DUF1192 family)